MAMELPPGFTAAEGDGGASAAEEAQMEEQMEQMMQQILTPEAMQRLKTLGVVKKDKVRQVQMQIIQMARSGQLKQKIDDEQIKAMLNEGSSNQPKVTIKRRTYFDDEGEDGDSDSDLM